VFAAGLYRRGSSQQDPDYAQRVAQHAASMPAMPPLSPVVRSAEDGGRAAPIVTPARPAATAPAHSGIGVRGYFDPEEALVEATAALNMAAARPRHSIRKRSGLTPLSSS
jgi:hypothetical protein